MSALYPVVIALVAVVLFAVFCGGDDNNHIRPA